MLIAGILFLVMAALMLIFPRLFLKVGAFSAKRLPDREKVIRVQAIIWLVIAVLLIIIGALQ